MSNSIEEIMKNVGYPNYVGIEIWNKSSSKILTGPETCGQVDTQPTPTIIQGQKEVCIFKPPKRDGNVVRVLSYKLDNTQNTLLVSNFNKGKIEYALYVPNRATLTNKDLYNKMYNNLMEPASFTKIEQGRSESSTASTIKGIYLHVSATMSNKKKVILKIDIRVD